MVIVGNNKKLELDGFRVVEVEEKEKQEKEAVERPKKSGTKGRPKK